MADTIDQPKRKRRSLRRAIIRAVAKALEKPLVLTNVQAARLVGCSPHTWHLMKSTGELPRPIQLPGTKALVYRRTDVERFIAGIPRESSGLPRRKGRHRSTVEA